MSNPNMPEKGSRTTLMFSATFAQDVQAKANEHLKVCSYLDPLGRELILSLTFAREK